MMQWKDELLKKEQLGYRYNQLKNKYGNSLIDGEPRQRYLNMVYREWLRQMAVMHERISARQPTERSVRIHTEKCTDRLPNTK